MSGSVKADELMDVLYDIVGAPPADTPKDRTLQEQIDQLAEKVSHLAAQVDRLMAERRTA